jgi:hypothetical protein
VNLGPLNFFYFLIFHHFTAEPQRHPTVIITLTAESPGRVGDTQGDQGPMSCFLKIFSPKILTKELAFFAQTTAIFELNDHNIGF